MVPKVKENFPSKFRNKYPTCSSCEQPESTDSQRHLVSDCPALRDIREQYDTETDLGIVEFFRAVIDRRIQGGDI